MLIGQVLASDCYHLRETILRPGQPKENWTFDTDDDPRAIHLGVKNGEDIIGVISLLPEKNEEVPNHPMRLRGMAVKKHMQGQGVGRQLLVALLANANDGVWCTARKHVAEFYTKNGFEIFGAEFTMNNMPHVYMRSI